MGELLKKQEANLLHKTEVVQMEIGEESNVAAQMMNDVFAFNTEEESEETEEMDSRMTAVQCAMPAAEEFPFLASTALDKINNMIALLNAGSSHDELAERLSFRFSEVVDFILNSDRAEKCPSVPTIGCFNFD